MFTEQEYDMLIAAIADYAPRKNLMNYVTEGIMGIIKSSSEEEKQRIKNDALGKMEAETKKTSEDKDLLKAKLIKLKREHFL